MFSTDVCTVMVVRLVTVRLGWSGCVQVQEAGGGDAESLQQNHHQAAEHLQNGRGAGQQDTRSVCVCVCRTPYNRVLLLLTAGPEADGLDPGAAGSAGERDAARPRPVCQREPATARGTPPLPETSSRPASCVCQACRIRDPAISKLLFWW